ncbi:DUF3135 domain-containing protein [Aeromonas fluvialis]|uniref:DUF3135 domain-containing protein n=1 Tax=Aeromonas fluvialis TaxID=591962 RepID=UPI0005A6DE44|nr:DUF3135 domain-containing protein [Aeromonas fluvialis]
MELPDFDTLKELAAKEPSMLDVILQQQIDQLMAQASPDLQRRLLGLQFKIDGQRRLAKNNLDSCIRIANMMRESFYLMRSEMLQLREEGKPLPENDGDGKIICLADYKRRK